MKITKFVHSCLVVETPDRVTVFDPGVMSEQALVVDQLDRVDDIVITHAHPDHFSLTLVKELVAKFPAVRITAPTEVVAALAETGITATDQPSDGIVFFDSPHENVTPMFPTPQEIGVHYLDQLSHPGDSHSFTETKAILALPITAPWGSSVAALNLALKLAPKYVIPIHDWHWRDEAREQTYERFEQVLGEQGIAFFKAETGVPIEITL
jgi:L-ascorbate metabolism protein UlaG (beta-lactamase superfamily)